MYLEVDYFTVEQPVVMFEVYSKCESLSPVVCGHVTRMLCDAVLLLLSFCRQCVMLLMIST